MKVGDTFPVSLAGSEVTRAKVTSMEDGIATLRFDGAVVKMTYVTQLAPEAPAPVEEPSKQVIIDGVDRANPNGESAPVGGAVIDPAPVQNTDNPVSPGANISEVSGEVLTPPVDAAEAAQVPQENISDPEAK